MRRFIRTSHHTDQHTDQHTGHSHSRFHHHPSFPDPHSRSRAELEVIADHHRHASPSADVIDVRDTHDRRRSVGHQRVA